VKEAAIREAPRVINTGRKTLLEGPQMARKKLETVVTDQTKKVVERMEGEVDRFLGQEMKLHVEEIDYKSSQIDASSSEKFELLITLSKKTFREKVKLFLSENFSDFTQEIAKLNQRLSRLNYDQDLTETEKIHQEILEVTVVLINRKDPLKKNEASKKKYPRLWVNPNSLAPKNGSRNGAKKVVQD